MRFWVIFHNFTQNRYTKKRGGTALAQGEDCLSKITWEKLFTTKACASLSYLMQLLQWSILWGYKNRNFNRSTLFNRFLHLQLLGLYVQTLAAIREYRRHFLRSSVGLMSSMAFRGNCKRKFVLSLPLA